MKQFLMVLAVLVFVGGCATTQKKVDLNLSQPTATVDPAKNGNGLIISDCAKMSRKEDGSMFISVKCGNNPILHIVVGQKPNIDYAVIIGNDPIIIVESTAKGEIVFKNQKGEDVLILPSLSNEELGKIRVQRIKTQGGVE